MAPTALAYRYTDQTAIEDLLSVAGLVARLDDDDDGVIASDELASLTSYAANYATAKVNGYVQGRYDPVYLNSSWQAWAWTTVVAARWICTRRCNPLPESIEALYEETIKELEMVRDGQMHISDARPRDEGYPAWSNVEVDQRYGLRKIRVQLPISDNSSADYPQKRSRWSDSVTEF